MADDMKSLEKKIKRGLTKHAALAGTDKKGGKKGKKGKKDKGI